MERKHFVKKNCTHTELIDIPPAFGVCELTWPWLTATEGVWLHQRFCWNEAGQPVSNRQGIHTYILKIPAPSTPGERRGPQRGGREGWVEVGNAQVPLLPPGSLSPLLGPTVPHLGEHLDPSAQR